VYCREQRRGLAVNTHPVALAWSVHSVPGTATVLTGGSGEFQEHPEKLFTIGWGAFQQVGNFGTYSWRCYIPAC